MPELNIRKIRRSSKKLTPEAETEVEGDEEPEVSPDLIPMSKVV